jgi:hypothetical protein
MSQEKKIEPSPKDQLRRKLQLGIYDPLNYGARPFEHFKSPLYEKSPQVTVKHKQ